jgi:D-alanyl-D-alanine carboxypeptidase-like protein
MGIPHLRRSPHPPDGSKLTLRERQALFSALLPRLLDKAFALGFDVSMGEVWRPPKMASIYASMGIGIANSLHTQRLAVDLNLWRDGTLLTRSEDYRDLGWYWKSLHELARWGGDWKHRSDGAHFSITFAGVQ